MSKQATESTLSKVNQLLSIDDSCKAPDGIMQISDVLNARLSMQGAVPDERGIYSINEPSCGGGGMIIAAAQALKDKGVNYRKYMDVVAQDLDWKGVHMCYLQLSLLGIKAVCVQGDSLAEPYIKGKYPQNRVLYTPAKAGVLI